MGTNIVIPARVSESIKGDLGRKAQGGPERWKYPARDQEELHIVREGYLGEVPEDVEKKARSDEVKVIRRITTTAPINIATAAKHTIISGAADRRIRIHFLAFTVGGECDITLYDGVVAISGAMDFGGTSEPRGIVMGQGGVPFHVEIMQDFSILLSAAVQVSGFVVYNYE